MFSYKGIDKDYNYKVGSVEAPTMAEAIKKVKSKENIVIIVSLEKRSNSKLLNTIQSRISENFVKMQNKRKNNKSKKKEKKINTNSAQASQSIADKSPILKAIKNISTKVQPKESKPSSLEEEFYSDLNTVFKSDSSYRGGNEALSDKKVNSFIKKEPKKDVNSGKSINWDLINDSSSDANIKKNMKIKVKPQELLMFTRRLHIMLSSGVSLLSALSLLSETSEKNMGKVAKGVLEEIKLGSSFSEALSKYPRQFNSAYVSLISIGETSGELAECIADIIKMKEQEQKVLKKIKSASIYPGIIAAVLATMMIAASVFFMPRFNELYQDQDLKIPQFTQIVFNIASYVPYIAGYFIAAAVTIFILKKRFKKVNIVYTGIKDKLLLKIPVVKNVMNALYMYYFSSTISLMLKNGIRLSDTLSLAGRSINNIYIRSEIENVSQLMNHGFSFSEALGKQEYFDKILVNVVLTGEESGKMVYSLANSADFYNEELNRKVDYMMELVPPMSIVSIALIAAPVIIAAYLPILDMSSGAGLGL